MRSGHPMGELLNLASKGISRSFDPLGECLRKDPLTNLGRHEFLADTLRRRGTVAKPAAWHRQDEAPGPRAPMPYGRILSDSP
jgi:hypothetical protein